MKRRRCKGKPRKYQKLERSKSAEGLCSTASATGASGAMTAGSRRLELWHDNVGGGGGGASGGGVPVKVEYQAAEPRKLSLADG